VAGKKFQIARGETLEIVGARVVCMGEEIVLARQVRKGEQTLVLRDRKGVPAWSGGRRRWRS